MFQSLLSLATGDKKLSATESYLNSFRSLGLLIEYDSDLEENSALNCGKAESFSTLNMKQKVIEVMKLYNF